MSGRTGAILLAAGRSRRMGVPKLLLPFGGSTVARCVLDAFLRAPVDCVLAVVGPHSAALRRALREPRVTFVLNPDPESDMLASVRCALRALPPDVQTVAISPGDQPALKPETVRALFQRFLESGAGLLVPVYRGRRGHPLLLRAGLRQEILDRFDGLGLRALLQARADELVECPCPDPAVVQDIDTPEDYLRSRASP